MTTRPTHTKPSSFRFTPRMLEVVDEMAESLGTSRTSVFALGATLLFEHLGFKTRDAIAAVESITRVHGDDAAVVVTVTRWDRAKIEIAGKPARDWTAWPLVALSEQGEPMSKLGFYCRYEPLRTTFALGEIEDPEIGAQITVRAADLVELVLLRSKREDSMTPAERRAELRTEFELRREMDRLLAERGVEGIAGGDRSDEDEM